MSSDGTNVNEKQQPIINESQDPMPLIILIIICLFVLFVLYFGFTASKQPLGYILGVTPILFSIALALSDTLKWNILMFGMAGGILILPIIILSFITSLVYTRF